jgi:hypothetical protein
MKYLIAALLFVMSMGAGALSVSEYNNARNDEQSWARVNVYLDGVGEGLSFASAVLIYQGKEPLYCPPDKIVLEPEDYTKAIDTFIENNPVYPELKIESILVRSLITAFPCPP